MREIRLHIWCDDHYDTHGAHVEDVEHGTQPIITVPELGARRLDLCGESDAELVQPLRELLAGLGKTDLENRPAVPPRQATEAPQPTLPLDTVGDGQTCPFCGSVQAKASGVINHIWIVHTASRGQDRPKYDECPECGWKGVDGKGFLPQSLAAHRRSKHGYDALTEAINAAKADYREAVRS